MGPGPQRSGPTDHVRRGHVNPSDATRGDDGMVMRYWRGWTTPGNADAYERIVSEEVLPGIAARGLRGYHGAYLLRRETGGEVEFATIMVFDSLDAVRDFGGDDYETAYVPPRVREVLERFDERSAHYEVLMSPDRAA